MKRPNHGAPETGAETKTMPAIEPCRILLVEDSRDDQLLEKKALEASEGIESVVCFSNGAELIAYMRERGFHDHSVMCLTPTIIVVDLNMPQMDGFEVLEQLKHDTFLEEIPIVVVSHEISEDKVRRAYELKADGFFRKPLQANRLRRVLGKAWRWPPTEMWMS